MKNKLAWLLLFAFFPLLVVAAEAVAAPATPEVPNFVLVFLTNLIATHPKVATLVGILGTMRLWAKPAFTLIHSVVDTTPSTKDDAVLGKVTNFFAANPVGKMLAYLLDYVTSIKIVPVQPKPTVTDTNSP